MGMDLLNVGEVLSTNMTAGAGIGEDLTVVGHYNMVCTDAQGNTLWEEGFDNLVPTVGLNQLLASGVFGSLPGYMGIMGGSSATVSATDTMASHSGWAEATSSVAPTWTGSRATLTFGAPSAGVTSTTSTNSYVFTGSGSVQGGFIAFGPSAAATQGSSAGVLMSAGTITAQPVINTNTITMSYTLTL